MQLLFSAGANRLRQLKDRLGAFVRWPSLLTDAMWTMSAKIFIQISQLATFIVAARVLASAEFGLFAYVAAVVALLVIFAEGGWCEFVMKMRDDADRLNQIASVALFAGLCAMSIGLGLAVVLGFVLHLPQVGGLVALFSLWLLPTPFSAVCDGVFVSGGRLRQQAIVRIVAEACGMSVAIGGLLAGWNILALVAGRLASQIVTVVLFVAILRWVPKLHLRAAFLRELLDFSRHIVANRLIIFLRSYSGTLVVGSVLGLTEAGYYRAAERVVAAFSEVVGEPARMLAWVVLRRVAVRGSDDGEVSRQIGTAATKFVIMLMAVSAPVYIGLALMSGTMVHVALGEAWAPASLLVTLLAIKQVLLVPGYVTEPILSLSGTIRRMPPAILVNSLVSLAFILVLSPFGMVAAAIGQCAAALFSFGISARLQSRYGEVNWTKVLRGCAHPAIALVAMTLVVVLLGSLATASSMSGLPVNFLQVVAGGVIYLGTLVVLQRLIGGSLPIFAVAQRVQKT
ncbi:MAG: polysaccharide biosynthesis protein [Shinella sp.]|nr:MAG: polysaccharide biosynthesis protein [Shinella sp.]